MPHPSLESFLASPVARTATGPVAVVLLEDRVEIASTLQHLCKSGFRTIVALAPEGIEVEPDAEGRIHPVTFDPSADWPLVDAVNRISAAVPEGTWLHYCYNAEYLLYPFCETRTVGEMLTFHAEERREAMLTYVVDLYSDDLAAHPDAVSLERAHLDKAGYFALARQGEYGPLDRQLDFYGGLRWRFEEHVPKARRRIDRISLFRTARGRTLRPDFTLSEEELNTYACAWHNNLTAAVCSFRTAKALKLNPGSTFDIESFTWYNSVPFAWTSRELMDLGLMEPGQWV
ncbi:hypothetical protein [Tropicimonas sp. IMCC34011]|uniref:hypothetical protein n=1 Tax=Tropicimonas sp. IMCC34011 TaxID=2248759 RepID=UPI000E26F20B|nr:hypothetical protein [Tropicimonas sp. IMCC34011]